MLLNLFSQVLITLNIIKFNNCFSAERDYEYQIMLYQYYMHSDTKLTQFLK